MKKLGPHPIRMGALVTS